MRKDGSGCYLCLSIEAVYYTATDKGGLAATRTPPRSGECRLSERRDDGGNVMAFMRR